MYNVGTQYSTSNGSGYRYDPIWPYPKTGQSSGNFQTVGIGGISYGYGCYLSPESILIYFKHIESVLEVRYEINVFLELAIESGLVTKIIMHIGKDDFYCVVEMNTPPYIDTPFLSRLFYEAERVIQYEKNNNHGKS